MNIGSAIAYFLEKIIHAAKENDVKLGMSSLSIHRLPLVTRESTKIHCDFRSS